MTELDEGEREEFFRLKKIQKNKEKHRNAAEIERKKWMDDQLANLTINDGKFIGSVPDPINLADTTDQDLLF